MAEKAAEKKQRIRAALAALEAAYPDARPGLDFTSPFELLVATMLSAQCTDKRVNMVTKELFPVYGTPEKLGRATPEEIIPYIRGCGLFNTKAKNLVATAKLIHEQFNDKVPEDRDTLMGLPGVGRKTANVVVSNAFGVPAIAVDTHVFRVSNRIGLAKADDVSKTEQQLMKNIPKEDWSRAHHWIIYHGRQVCAARKPKCDICTVREYCRAYLDKKI
ncbi:MAG: endonuclease III [Clostridia bacterium]|nr:endonuclease III [Clostridia bacterium]